MATGVREKFSSRAAPEVLSALRRIAESEGRQFQAVLDEALREHIERKEKGQPRRHVLEAFAQSLGGFDSQRSPEAPSRGVRDGRRRVKGADL